MKALKVVNIIALAVVVIGCLNWALVGIFDFNLVAKIFMGYRSVGSIIIYILVGISAIWLVASTFMSRGRIEFVEATQD